MHTWRGRIYTLVVTNALVLTRSPCEKPAALCWNAGLSAIYICHGQPTSRRRPHDSCSAAVCYTEKAPNAWQRRGTPKQTRNTYNQPNWPNRQTTQTKDQALPKGQRRCVPMTRSRAVQNDKRDNTVCVVVIWSENRTAVFVVSPNSAAAGLTGTGAMLRQSGTEADTNVLWLKPSRFSICTAPEHAHQARARLKTRSWSTRVQSGYDYPATTNS